MDRTVYDSLTYVQRGDYCVLASYAAAVWPWLRATPLTFFVAYCEELGLPSDPRGAEATYLADFIVRYSQPGWSGYKVVVELHNSAKHPLFRRAQSAADAHFVPDTIAAATHLEVKLQGAEHTLMTFVNKASFPGLVAGHSIAVLYDASFWHFDSNHGSLQPSASTLVSLGSLGEGILFEGRVPVALTT
jgi:hypothetical protein